MQHRTSFARWCVDVNGVQASAEMTHWLTDRGSLTAKLVARCAQFRVQRLSQRQATCLADECAELELARRVRVHERQVLLRCDGLPMVYAHTVLPLTATASEWPLFHSLGEKSLGTTLFNDPLVERGTLAYARLRATHPLVRRMQALKLPIAGHQALFARRSVFRRKGGCLLVTEVFLPQIAELQQMRATVPAVDRK
ncbi:chorismate--pyruvate lyase family protein [Undibacterium sp.]|uniref:chorismate--pyruvate lyase family protein n=1 Tax=Undibacterium sp. TaxID=1914977 RepID=UPI002BC6AB87|nr:chorismate lyase [Undibacterium sp.]HTD05600.1 chorismate lyase [Undibacterium sp.]